MARIHYKVVAHDGGWPTSSATCSPSLRHAVGGAGRGASRGAEQHVPGNAACIEFQDEAGRWHTEYSAGNDRPEADVVG